MFTLPVVAACAGMAVVALLRPALLSPTIPACGRLVMAMLRGKRPENEQMLAMMGWLVKAVFLPLMLAWSFTWIAGAANVWHERSWLAIFAVAMALLYAVDTAFATVGYMSTSERIDGQIRSVDRTVLGWLSALACYPPLSVLILDTWLVYKTGSDWTAWFSSRDLWAWLWGSAILVLTSIYTWSSVVFGPRFSNLTNRGIITSGPYQWGKHPAYLCKNLSWWLIFVPFLGNETAVEAFLHCLALLGVNAIYALRAWTEERHLNADPEYRAYALWISRHGLLARAKRVIRRPTPAERQE
ncbi:isoprenylcysteine carboxylmethyltransferase family protein [Stenotrophomonas sp. NPDC047960]|uniref:isoprenylcysteine carboxylmethyltransferase family protein n=1 Tax=Stenotrophomonas sp. NPDC047960 TaxID=3364531 RepID=UPI00371E573E